ncbi:unnamed protein product [Rodentolepis nana]|uniref:Tetraspanin n=1 Tax=Rodentolepis nana TaxID=102285 RepID=A0A0R3T708_RODNA|nr:unnamed protein product [Rodentolepis nana]
MEVSECEGEIASIVMVAFGIFLLIQSNSFGFSGSEKLVPVFITIVGVILLAVAILGFVAAITLRRSLLLAFAIGMGLIILAEIAGGILLFVYRAKFKEGLKNYLGKMVESIAKGSNPTTQKVLQKIQNAFGCCGARGPQDWCKQDGGNGSMCPKDKKTGCIDVIYAWIKKNLLAAGAVVLALALLEIGAMAAASCLYKQSE